MANERYKYQIPLPGWGKKGQDSIEKANVAVVGCGGLGSNSSLMLARAGVTRLNLIDPDGVEMSNIHRQCFSADAATFGTHKVLSLLSQVTDINPNDRSMVQTLAVNAGNIDNLIGKPDVIVDGLDNWETRYLLNDYAVKHGIPFIYGAVSGVIGVVYTVLPKTKKGNTKWEKQGIWTHDLRSIFGPPVAPRPKNIKKRTPGILAPMLPIVANLQVIEALKILTGNFKAVNPNVVSYNGWDCSYRSVDYNSHLPRR